MADVLTARQRSFCMSRIKAGDTRPEILVRNGLWTLGSGTGTGKTENYPENQTWYFLNIVLPCLLTAVFGIVAPNIINYSPPTLNFGKAK